MIKSKIPFLCLDEVFKSIFTDYPNILGKMISDITGIEYKLIRNNIELITNEIPIKRYEEKFKKCDFIVKIDDNNIINLEINTKNYKEGKIKNLSYSFDLFASNSSKGEKYNKDFKLIQININYYKTKIEEVLTEYRIVSKDKRHIDYLDNFKIVMLNIYKSHEIYYNRTNSESIPNYIKWGELLYNEDISKIPEIMEGILTKGECENLMGKMNNLMSNDEYRALAKKWILWEEKAVQNRLMDEAKEKGMKKGLKKGMEQGIQQGIEQGIEQGKNSIALNMLNEGSDINFISKITGLSIDKINSLR